jgi:ribosomal protein S6
MIYEVSYLVLPTVGEDALAPEVSKLKETLAGVEAKVIGDEYPSLINLQYEMTKRIDTKNVRFDQAYFGWVKFEAESDSVAKIKKAFDLNKMLLRYLIVTTVRENTLSAKKNVATLLSPKSARSTSIVKEEVVVAPIDEEVVDQEIDKLVEETASVETND